MAEKVPFFAELIPARVALPLDPDAADAWEPPAYGTKGWVLVEVLEVFDKRQPYRFELGDYAVDDDASTFWIKEGVGMEFWLDAHAPDEFDVGWWVFEDVVGTYHRGDGWMTDDDETWEYGTVRPATPEEIEAVDVLKPDDPQPPKEE